MNRSTLYRLAAIERHIDHCYELAVKIVHKQKSF